MARIVTSRVYRFVLLSAVVLTSCWTLVAYSQTPEAANWYNQALQAYAQGNRDQALNLFEQAAQADPAYGDTYYNIGTIAYQLNLLDKAAQAFERLVQLNPNDGQARYNLALTYEKQNRIPLAVETYRQIQSNQERYPQAQEKILALTQPTQAPSNPGQTPEASIAVLPFAKDFQGPTGIAIDTGGRIFVANYSQNQVDYVHPDGRKELFAQGPLLNGPVGMVYNPKTRELYVANYLGNSVVTIAADGKVTPLASGLKKPYYLMLDAANNSLFISEQESNAVSRIQLH